tara:strand:+ start:2269 stop:2991 length:723 start_codon:yes stop_codon:yes gene_type:complete
MSEKLDILAIGAHPDDIELGCGGTLMKEIEMGKKVGLMDLTQGELGTRGSKEIRKQEAELARDFMGAKFRDNLLLDDCFFENNRDNQIKLISKIRRYQPDIIMCNATDDRHIDHQKAAKLVVDSCFLSGLKKIETTFDGNIQDVWRPVNVYHYIQWKNLEPDFVIDISKYMKQKFDLINCYKSQFYNDEKFDDNTPISTKNFLDSITYRARDLGRLVGVEAAEGFLSSRFPIVDRISGLK